MSGIEQVDPNTVEIRIDLQPLERDILQQAHLLNRQGQIEPLMLDPRYPNEYVITDHDWPYASAQVIAARRLEWPTVIVTREQT